MSGNKLFLQRFSRELRDRWGIVRSVLDLTVMLYIAVPAVAIAPFLYADLWRNVHTYWNDQMPAFFMPVLILLLSAGGNIRTWLREADLLFLIQKDRLLRQLKRCGLLCSLLSLITVEALLLVLALPVLVEINHFSLPQILSLFLVACSFKLAVMTIRKLTDRMLYRRLLIVLAYMLAAILVLMFQPLLWTLCGLSAFILLIWLNGAQLMKTNRWFRELEIENAEHVRLIRFFLKFSTEIEKPASIRKKPLFLFRRSERIFKTQSKENGLLELLLKTFWRSGTCCGSYLQVIGLTCFAGIAFPVWLKWIVFILFILFIKVWLNALFHKMTANPFFRIVPFNSEISASVRSRFQKWLAVPAILLAGAAVGLSTLFHVDLV